MTDDKLGQRLLTEAQTGLYISMSDDYDHGYYFIATFMEDHLRFHADILNA